MRGWLVIEGKDESPPLQSSSKNPSYPAPNDRWENVTHWGLCLDHLTPVGKGHKGASVEITPPLCSVKLIIIIIIILSSTDLKCGFPSRFYLFFFILHFVYRGVVHCSGMKSRQQQLGNEGDCSPQQTSQGRGGGGK